MVCAPDHPGRVGVSNALPTLGWPFSWTAPTGMPRKPWLEAAGPRPAGETHERSSVRRDALPMQRPSWNGVAPRRKASLSRIWQRGAWSSLFRNPPGPRLPCGSRPGPREKPRIMAFGWTGWRSPSGKGPGKRVPALEEERRRGRRRTSPRSVTTATTPSAVGTPGPGLRRLEAGLSATRPGRFPHTPQARSGSDRTSALQAATQGFGDQPTIRR